ncbi:hypothetical protein OF83DRAFT_1065534 [Amylostereum chailletii]|nr:hypothetical protein OF83DRAFT_1065534 [Amylostereum chailletii]
MLTITFIMFFLSTMRLTVDAKNHYVGFSVLQDPVVYFANIKMYIWKDGIFLAQTLLGDATLIYRCYIVWRSWKIILLPCLMWCSIAATGAHAIWTIGHPAGMNSTIFARESHAWILSTYVTALATNLVATGILAYKLWIVNASMQRYSKNSLMPVIVVVMECGALYSCTLIVLIFSFVFNSFSMYIIVDLTGPLIPIVFYLIIIRAVLARIGSSPKTAELSSIRVAPRMNWSERSQKTRTVISLANATDIGHGSSSSLSGISQSDPCRGGERDTGGIREIPA